MMRNKKGFTLVELLVAISILGIIMIIALPLISNIQNNNKKTKYKKYAESMLTSAKLYTDSYTEDMFGNNKSGCYDIPYSAMKDKGLLKNIEIDGSTCNSENTFIRVRKANDYYFYETSVYCKDKNGKVVYDAQLPKNVCDESGPDVVGPTITITPDSKEDWTKGTNTDVTIKIWDKYGMLENTKIKLSWTKDGNDYKTDSYDFKNKRYEGQSEENALEYTFKVPQNATGSFVLTVIPVDVRDSVGNYQVYPVKSGEYKLDNTPPTCTSSGGSTSWTNQDVTIIGICEDIGGSGCKGNASRTYSANINTTTASPGTVSDNLGNTAECPANQTVKIDKDVPTCGTMTVTGTKGWDDWYVKKEDIKISTKDGSDAVSGHKSTVLDKSSITTEGIQTVTLTTTDNAGNICTISNTIKADWTAPTIKHYQTVKNGNPGYNTTFYASDTGGSNIKKFIRSHCFNCSSYEGCCGYTKNNVVYSAKQRVEYVVAKNTIEFKDLAYANMKKLDSSSQKTVVCPDQISDNKFNAQGYFTMVTSQEGGTTHVQYAFKVYDGAGNSSDIFTYKTYQ